MERLPCQVREAVFFVVFSLKNLLTAMDIFAKLNLTKRLVEAREVFMEALGDTVTDNLTARKRILDVAQEMFSQKGFAATRVDKIAQMAGVNKALIYYYFPSKEAILDYLIDSFFEELSASSMTLVQNSIVKFVHDGRLDILTDRFEFATADDLKVFLGELKKYYEKMLDDLLERRQILRILMMESLSDGKHKGELFRYHAMAGKADSPLFKAVRDTDGDFAFDDELFFNKFFFSLIPLISFAVYSSDYAQASGQSAETLKEFYLRFLFGQFTNYIDGKTLLFSPASMF